MSGEAFVTWLTPTAVQWAKAPQRTGRFGKVGRLTGGSGFPTLRLYRGRRGAMLATVEQQANGGPSAKLFTYGER